MLTAEHLLATLGRLLGYARTYVVPHGFPVDWLGINELGGEPRRLPDHHVCVVLASSIAQLLPEALPRLDITRPLTWISGPSATSDIELERVEGVHGPRRLVVVVALDL